jgi:hypothetical protein
LALQQFPITKMFRSRPEAVLEIRQEASFATIFDFLLNALGEYFCRVAWPFAEPTFTWSCTTRQQKRTDRFDFLRR